MEDKSHQACFVGSLFCLLCVTCSVMAAPPRTQAELEAVQARVNAAAEKYEIRSTKHARLSTPNEVASSILNQLQFSGLGPDEQLEVMALAQLNDQTRTNVKQLFANRLASVNEFQSRLCEAANDTQMTDTDVVRLALNNTSVANDLSVIADLKEMVSEQVREWIEKQEAHATSNMRTFAIDESYYLELADLMRTGYRQNCSDPTPNGVLDGVVK